MKNFVPAALRVVPLVALSLLLSACGGQREQLVPIRNAQPAGVDLSGLWRMDDDPEAMERRLDRAVRQTDGVDERRALRRAVGTTDTQRTRRTRRRTSDVGGLVHVFLESAPTLRVTQTRDGLFISFDRSVVEEYRFGEARQLQTGGAIAQRVSGWEGSQYVIETLDESGMKMTERYSLASGGRRLVREIVLRSAQHETVTVVQNFRKEA